MSCASTKADAGGTTRAGIVGIPLDTPSATPDSDRRPQYAYFSAIWAIWEPAVTTNAKIGLQSVFGRTYRDKGYRATALHDVNATRTQIQHRYLMRTRIDVYSTQNRRFLHGLSRVN